MSTKRILLAAMMVLGLTQFGRADNKPEVLPSPIQVATPLSPYGATYTPSQSIGVPMGAESCTTGGCASCAAGQCAGKDRSCWEALCGFFTYRRAPYTDINTYCCGCSGPARPPLYVYMLHPCAEQRLPYALPDLSKCKGDGCGQCGKCGRVLERGCSSCPVCSK